MTSVKGLLSKYIQNTERALAEIKISQEERQIGGAETSNVIEEAKRYLEDAKYYRDKKRFKTALASVAYCEGLLDALRLLALVEFTWPTENKAKHSGKG